MGSNTYNAAPMKPSKMQRLVVMTHNPLDYKTHEVAGQVEFTDESPATLIACLQQEGHEQVAIVGGAKIATSFLKEQLIDELWLTIEPKIFGQGKNFVTPEKLEINLQLISCEKVNKQGTLITKYAIIKNLTD